MLNSDTYRSAILETRTKPFSSYKSIGELFQNIQFSSENFPTFVRAFRKYKYMGSINYDLKKIKGFIFDVDGVLSPDSIPLHPSGEPMRVINTKDGYAMQLAAKQGYQLAIITGGDTQSVRKRFESLGFQRVYLKAKHKIDEFKDFLARTGLDPEEICYVGDDIPDYEVMQLVGLPVCPADAAPEIKNISKYISPKEGGKGVGRDVIEQVLKAQDKWMKSDAFGW